MADPLTFHMGKFAAVLPADLRYCRNHMWCRADGRIPQQALWALLLNALPVVHYRKRSRSRH